MLLDSYVYSATLCLIGDILLRIFRSAVLADFTALCELAGCHVQTIERRGPWLAILEPAWETETVACKVLCFLTFFTSVFCYEKDLNFCESIFQTAMLLSAFKVWAGRTLFAVFYVFYSNENVGLIRFNIRERLLVDDAYASFAKNAAGFALAGVIYGFKNDLIRTRSSS